jgi:MoxR-like ATPase
MDWDLIDRVIDASSDTNLLLYGPRGTGKTRLANTVLRRTRADVFNVTLTEDMSVSELIGMFVPDQQGGFSWVDGPALLAWRSGGGLVLNEIDHAAGAVAMQLHAILDDPEVARLSLPDGRTVQPAPGFRAIATMNGRPGDLEEALLDRFTVRLPVTHPHPDAVAGMPIADREFLRDAYSDPELMVSFREYRQFLRLCERLSEQDAARAVWDGRGADVISARRLGKRRR